MLTLRIDNRTVVDVGPNAHSVSDHTQGNWNGVVGELRLEAVPPVTIRRVTVVPDVARRSARVRVDLAGGPLGIGHGSVTVSARRFNVPGEHVPPPVTASYDSDGAQELTDHPRDLGERGMTGSGGHLDVDLPLGADAQTWDEFHPALYEVTVELLATVRDRRDHDTRRTTFGLREVGVRGTQVTVNDRPTFLRGTLESAVWPLTGYPPTEVEPWRRVLRTVRAHGLNLVRFHSWCPPEAAFTAADLEGVLLQVEGPVWANQGAALGEGRPVDRFLHEETERILEAYGNHPRSWPWRTATNPPAATWSSSAPGSRTSGVSIPAGSGRVPPGGRRSRRTTSTTCPTPVCTGGRRDSLPGSTPPRRRRSRTTPPS